MVSVGCVLGITLSYLSFFYKFQHYKAVATFKNERQQGTSHQKIFVPIVWSKTGPTRNAQTIDSLFHGSGKDSIAKDQQWIFEYIEWHNYMRKKFPDTQILEDPEAPSVLVLWNRRGGGLNDRLSNVPQQVYRAYIEMQVLLYKNPNEDSNTQLENFLQPNLINWTLPNHPLTASKNIPLEKYGQVYNVNNVTFHLQNHVVAGFPEDAWSIIWHALFKPSALLQSALDKLTTTLGLVPGQYDAAHCRVRHPAHFRSRNIVQEDLNGAKFTGTQRESAIQTAIRAIQCTGWISRQKFNYSRSKEDKIPLYFYSDAEQLVNSASGQNQPMDSLEAKLHNISLEHKVVVHNNTVPIAHLDSKNKSVESYLSTFVDAYIASNARCLAMGVGNFAALSAKMSSNDCLVNHEVIPRKLMNKWGMSRQSIENCNLGAD